MIQFLELPVNLAILTAIVLPIIAVCFFIITIPWLRNGTGSRLRRYLSYAITPPKLDSEESAEEDQSALSHSDKVEFSFYYLVIVLFLVSFVIGEFYEVMFDLALPVNQGNTGEYRTVTAVVFQSLFNVGCQAI